jgi:hypothetical protein
MSWQAGVLKLDSPLYVYCSIEFFFITTLHGPQEKRRLLLSRVVLGVFTAPMYNNGRGADHIENKLYR